MLSQSPFSNITVRSRGDRNDIVANLIEAGFVQMASLEMIPPISREREQKIIEQQDVTATSIFEKNREHFVPLFQAILHKVFHNISEIIPGLSKDIVLPTQNGVDVGSGSTGAMVERFLKPLINKDGWTQIELNAHARAALQKRYPDTRVYEGNYHELDKLGLNKNLEIITGLSSLDNTAHLTDAVESLRRTLIPGGYLLHVQDVRPGMSVQLEQLRHMKVARDIPVFCLPNKDILSYYIESTAIISCMELFRRAMERALRSNSNLEYLCNTYVTATKPGTSDKRGNLYYANMHIGNMTSDDEATVIVTLARNKGGK